VAQGISRLGEGSWDREGYFAFCSGRGENMRIHLAKLESNELRTVFATNVSSTVLFSPSCLTSGVVVVDVTGVITKFDLTGKFIFGTRLAAMEGTPSWSGKLDDRHIFVTETVWRTHEKTWQYRLYVVDVSGKEPFLTSKFDIIQPERVTRTRTQIVVIGEKKDPKAEASKGTRQLILGPRCF
jgi:hypothetical protein